MGNSEEKNKTKLSRCPNDDFNDSYLDIYLFGNYNPVMEIIIGEQERNEDYINIQGYEYKENKDYILIGQTPLDEKSNLNSLNERLIIKNNNSSKENENFEMNYEKFLKSFKNHKNKIMSEEPYKIRHPVFKWNMNFYCKESLNFTELSNVKDNFEKHFCDDQKNALIIFIDNLSIIFKAINIFREIKSEIHPLFLFVVNIKKMHKTKEQISIEIDNYLKGMEIKSFNIRNVTLLEDVDLFETPNGEDSYNFNKKRSDYIFGLYSFLINSWLYYNNLGDNFEFGKHLGQHSNIFLEDINNKNSNINIKSNIGLFNIIIVGKPGVGKSTLINVLSKSKRSREGKGESVTKKIINYIIKDYNISFYDTPGFESDNDINETIQLINNLQKHLIEGKHQINMAFYLIQGSRDFYNNERKILKTLMENNIPTFFLLTFSPSLEKGNEFKQIIEINLRRAFKQFDKNKGIEYYNKQVKTFPVHLLDENDGSCNNFGIKTCMEAIFEKFKYCIIEDNELQMLDNIMDSNQKRNSDDNSNRVKEVLNLLDGKEIYKHFKDIDDILSSSIDQTNSVISYYSKFGSALSLLNLLFFPSAFIYLTTLKKNLLIEILRIFKKFMDDKEKEELLSNYSKEINDYDKVKSNIPFFNICYNNQNIYNFGTKYAKIFTEELKKSGIDGVSMFIKDYIGCYNNAIKGIKIIGQNFND